MPAGPGAEKHKIACFTGVSRQDPRRTLVHPNTEVSGPLQAPVPGGRGPSPTTTRKQLETAFPPSFAAVIVEVIQGEGRPRRSCPGVRGRPEKRHAATTTSSSSPMRCRPGAEDRGVLRFELGRPRTRHHHLGQAPRGGLPLSATLIPKKSTPFSPSETTGRPSAAAR